MDKFSFILLIILAKLGQALVGEHGALASNYQLKTELTTVQIQFSKVAKENEQLRMHLNNLKQNNQLLEEIARHDLNMLKEGETFYQIAH